MHRKQHFLSLLDHLTFSLHFSFFAFPTGVNFINVLRAAFTSAVPKSAKKQSSCQSFLHFQDLLAQKLLKERWWNWPFFLSINFTSLLHVHHDHQKMRSYKMFDFNNFPSLKAKTLRDTHLCFSFFLLSFFC
jgi:hypothetical protein